MAVAIGSSAPGFKACNPEGFASVTNDDFSGKTVVLSFFPAAFSGAPEEGCEMQLCGMNHLASQADQSKFIFYGVSGDLPFANAAFGKKLGLSFPLLSDPTLETCEKYVGKCQFGKFLKEHKVSTALEGTVTSNRGCVIIGPDGSVLYSFSGDGDPRSQPSMAEISKIVGA